MNLMGKYVSYFLIVISCFKCMALTLRKYVTKPIRNTSLKGAKNSTCTSLSLNQTLKAAGVF